MLYKNTKPSISNSCGKSIHAFARIPFLAGVCLLLGGLLFGATEAKAQGGLELNGGYAHITGDFGTDGFSVGAGWHFSDKFALIVNYDDTYDTSRVGAFEFTSVGVITSKSHLQEYLVGPRYYFVDKTVKNHTIHPFIEAQFGDTHLNSKISEGTMPTEEISGTAFSWQLGGGVDYQVASHFDLRTNLDFLRTHLNDAGQSRLRFVLGVVYYFSGR